MRPTIVTYAAAGILLAAMALGGCSSDESADGLPPAGAAMHVARSVPPAGDAWTRASGAGHADPTRRAVDLPTVMRLASGRNLDVQMVREKLRAAHADMVQAGWWVLPTIRPGVRFRSVNGTVQATEGAIRDVDKHSAFVGAGVYVDWEVGEALFEQLAAKQRAGASRHALRAAVGDATVMAAEAYFDVLRAQTALAIADQSLTLYDTLVSETQASVDAGGGFRGDVLRARAKLSHARVVQRRATGDQRAAALRLAELLDLPSTVELYASEGEPVMIELIDPTGSEDELLREALGGRPEVGEARASARAAEADRNKTTLGPWIPRVTAGVEGGGFGSNLGRMDGTSDAGVGLEWRIGRGGIGDKARAASAAARERQSRIRIKQVRARIVREVAGARSMALNQAQAIQAAEAGVKDAKEALDLFQQRQRVGVGIPLDAIVAEETLTQSRLDYLDAVIDYNKAQVRLLHAVGHALK